MMLTMVTSLLAGVALLTTAATSITLTASPTRQSPSASDSVSPSATASLTRSWTGSPSNSSSVSSEESLSKSDTSTAPTNTTEPSLTNSPSSAPSGTWSMSRVRSHSSSPTSDMSRTNSSSVSGPEHSGSESSSASPSLSETPTDDGSPTRTLSRLTFNISFTETLSSDTTQSKSGSRTRRSPSQSQTAESSCSESGSAIVTNTRSVSDEQSPSATFSETVNSTLTVSVTNTTTQKPTYTGTVSKSVSSIRSSSTSETLSVPTPSITASVSPAQSSQTHTKSFAPSATRYVSPTVTLEVSLSASPRLSDTPTLVHSDSPTLSTETSPSATRTIFPTPTSTITPPPTPTPSATTTQSLTDWVSTTRSSSDISTESDTISITVSTSVTKTLTLSTTKSKTPTITPPPTPSATQSSSHQRSDSQSLSDSEMRSASLTHSVTSTITPPPTPTPTASESESITLTASATATITPPPTPTPSHSLSFQQSISDSVSSSPTATSASWGDTFSRSREISQVMINNTFRLRIAGDWAVAIVWYRAEVEAAVIECLSVGLDVPAWQITIHSLVAGSLVVSFSLNQFEPRYKNDTAIVALLQRTNYTSLGVALRKLTFNVTSVDDVRFISAVFDSDIPLSPSSSCGGKCIGIIVACVLVSVGGTALGVFLVWHFKLWKRVMALRDKKGTINQRQRADNAGFAADDDNRVSHRIIDDDDAADYNIQSSAHLPFGPWRPPTMAVTATSDTAGVYRGHITIDDDDLVRSTDVFDVDDFNTSLYGAPPSDVAAAAAFHSWLHRTQQPMDDVHPDNVSDDAGAPKASSESEGDCDFEPVFGFVPDSPTSAPSVSSYQLPAVMRSPSKLQPHDTSLLHDETNQSADFAAHFDNVFTVAGEESDGEGSASGEAPRAAVAEPIATATQDDRGMRMAATSWYTAPWEVVQSASGGGAYVGNSSTHIPAAEVHFITVSAEQHVDLLAAAASENATATVVDIIDVD